jgi:UDP-N-acetylmuramoyl-tripeptide--D-alanyl-D-alanine ligase
MSITFWILWAAFAAFAAKRLMTYLHIFQQEEYNALRFLNWMIKSAAFDRRISLAFMALALLGFAGASPASLHILGALALFAAFWFEADPRQTGKKKLVLTSRAKRILGAAFGIAVIGAAFLGPVWGWIGAVQVLPLLLIASNFLWTPFESFVQRKYWAEAHNRLLAVAPAVIGVTGSFGKTSVKHLLGHVLQTHARTYFTPGSVNSPMGVSRALREEMPEDCKYYVGEMGAYGVGSIARLCRLTPPSYGIITALGEAHYERFGSLDNVARAKFELADAVLAKNGKMVVSENVLAQPYARDFVNAHRAAFLICGFGNLCDVRILSTAQTKTGTAINLSYQGKTHSLTAPIWGEHQAGNIALVFGMALTLGLAPEQIAIALKSAPQTKHRLEVKPQPDGSIYIDDAYNSNPAGFASALGILTLLRPEGGRRILVTPGMAELGEKHDELHRELGQKAAANADIILAVKPERIGTFIEGAAALGAENILKFPNFAQAQNWLAANVQRGDVVLLENDLPDLYEKKVRL